MGKLLFVGVTCADVAINVDRLPRTAQDVVVYGQRMTLGGCAFNAFAVAHALGEPAVLFSPVGTGAFRRLRAQRPGGRGGSRAGR